MRDLTAKELKATLKLQLKFNFFELTQAHRGLTNGQLLSVIRYCKRLKLK